LFKTAADEGIISSGLKLEKPSGQFLGLIVMSH
jgi:hypothetical protein